MAAMASQDRPRHLDPSILGDKEHWDQTYQDDLDNLDEDVDITDLDSWFSETNAPAKILQYLTREDFPLSPTNTQRTVERPNILDLGCGNGSSLFELKINGGFTCPMIGIDYSQQSIDLAKHLWIQHTSQQDDNTFQGQGPITFEQFDFLKEDAENKLWYPEGGFDLVLDKGTFDAVSLSGQTIEMENGVARIVEMYPRRAAQLVKPGGFLLITSVNWTEDEVVEWFTKGTDIEGVLAEYGKIKYPSFGFGGSKGTAVVSICFQKIQKSV